MSVWFTMSAVKPTANLAFTSTPPPEAVISVEPENFNTIAPSPSEAWSDISTTDEATSAPKIILCR